MPGKMQAVSRHGHFVRRGLKLRSTATRNKR